MHFQNIYLIKLFSIKLKYYFKCQTLVSSPGRRPWELMPWRSVRGPRNAL